MSQRYGLDGGLFSFGVKSVSVAPLVESMACLFLRQAPLWIHIRVIERRVSVMAERRCLY